jgi:hypothetical protein
VNSGRIKAFSHIASAYFSKIKGDFLNIMIISEADPEREEALVKKYILADRHLRINADGNVGFPVNSANTARHKKPGCMLL